MLTVLGWLWENKASHHRYTIEHANRWAHAIHDHLKMPHRFVVLTDQPRSSWGEFCELILPLELWPDYRELSAPDWWPAHKPHCWRRLKAFSAEARKILGDRFVSIDMDCLILGSLDRLFDRPEDFIIYKNPSPTHKNFYQGSMWLMDAGSRRQVWDSFRGQESATAAAAHFIGTDQAWICHCLGPGEATWSQKDGVYSWAMDVRAQPKLFASTPPKDARIIFFQGEEKPWENFDRRPQFNWVYEVQRAYDCRLAVA